MRPPRKGKEKRVLQNPFPQSYLKKTIFGAKICFKKEIKNKYKILKTHETKDEPKDIIFFCYLWKNQVVFCLLKALGANWGQLFSTALVLELDTFYVKYWLVLVHY